MSSDDHMQPLINPLPPVVAALAVAIFGIEVILWAASRGYVGGAEAVGWRLEAIRSFSFSGPLLEDDLARGRWASPEFLRLLTYPFVHFGFTHALFVIVFLLALGKLIGEVMGNLAVLATFFLSAIFGAVVYAGLTGDPRPLTGGFPAVYGLIGTYTFLLWTSYGRAGGSQWRAFTLIAFLLGIQLFFGLLFGSSRDWVAEVAGFAFGFAASPLLVPGGIRRLLDRLRQR